MELIIVLVMFMICFALKRAGKQYSPAFLFFTYWMINLLAAIVLYNEYNWNGWSFCIILLFSSCYLLLENYSFKYNTLFSEESKGYVCSKVHEKTNIINIVIIICFFSGFGYLVLSMLNNQISFNISSFDELISVSHQFTVMRYGSEEAVVSLPQQICLGTLYYGGLISGFYYPIAKIKNDKSVICFIVFLPDILCTLVTNSKTTIVFSLILWATGFILSKYFCDFKINFKFFFKLLLVAVALIFVMFLSFYIRYGGQTTSEIVDQMIVYATGHVSGFDNWLNNYNYTWFGQAYGSKSFENIFSLLHLPVFESNTNEIFVTTQYGITNVQTQFSDFVIDYGIMGTFLLFCFLGFISGMLLRKIGTKNNYALYITLIAALYFMALYSFLICPFKYTSCLLVFVEFYITLRIIFGGEITIKI